MRKRSLGKLHKDIIDGMKKDDNSPIY